MIYPKKSLLIFIIVALSTAAIAGFFIRQKILSDWKIAEFNALLKQIKELKENIDKDEKDLKNNEKLKDNVEEQIQNIKKDIEKFEESIKKNNKKLEELNVKGISNKRAEGIKNVLNKYKLLEKNKKEEIESSTNSKLFSIYERIISYYFYERHKMLKQRKKYTNIKQKILEQKENLKTKKIENENLLSMLKVEINKLIQNIKNKKLELTSLNNSRERERR